MAVVAHWAYSEARSAYRLLWL